MNSRERFHAVMNYAPVDRGVMMMPWLGFEETLENWKSQGYQEGDLDRYPLDDWHVPTLLFYPHPPFEHEVLEETDRHVLYTNEEGILMREFKDNRASSMPQFVKFPVQSREDFHEFAATRLQPDIAQRLGPDWEDQLCKMRRDDNVVWIIADRWGGFFGPLRNLFGVEELCVRFYTEPDFVEEVMDTIADYTIAQADQILDVIDIDMFGLWEDMAFNIGPLIDPELVRQYMLPRYRRVTEHLKSRGVPWISLDSDGRIDTLVPIWLDGGIDLIYPFEAAAGSDIVAMRSEHGRKLRMYMGVDKVAIKNGPAAIDAELERIAPLVREGGYIPNVDHSIPPDVPYAHFTYYMDRMQHLLYHL